MCRIESQPLRDVESKRAKERLSRSEERLIDIQECLIRKAIERRTGRKAAFTFSSEQRLTVRHSIERLANYC